MLHFYICFFGPDIYYIFVSSLTLNTYNMKKTTERKYNTTLEMLSRLERIMLINEMNVLPFGPEFDEAVEMRKSVTKVLQFLTDNK